MKKILILAALTLGGVASSAAPNHLEIQKTVIQVYVAATFKNSCAQVGQVLYKTQGEALAVGAKANANSLIKPGKFEEKEYTVFAGTLPVNPQIAAGYVTIVGKYPYKGRYPVTTCFFPLRR